MASNQKTIYVYCGLNTKDAAAMAADILKTARENWNRLVQNAD